MASGFGKFKLLRQIGGGRLSQVFEATALEAEVEARVALKRVLPAVIGEPAFVQLVVREAGLLARLSHPALCQCLEMGVVDGSAFFTLDLVDGCTLRALMRRTSRLQVQLPPSAIVAIGYQLAEALSYVHERCEPPLVHLDLSPQNVLLSQHGELKLIDFGIARCLDGRNPPPLGGKIAGTVGYMSPEQARGKDPDARADQFGLGILLWELLSGQRAFRGNTPETWQRMRAGQLPTGPEALRGAPEALVGTVMRLLEPEPERRFRDMSEVREQLAATHSQRRPRHEVPDAASLSGRRPLAALVQYLMQDPSFDPFDVARRPDLGPDAAAVPDGRADVEYAEIAIEVDHGAGTPGFLVRAAVPGGELPDSPFLEILPEAQATAEMAR